MTSRSRNGRRRRSCLQRNSPGAFTHLQSPQSFAKAWLHHHESVSDFMCNFSIHYALFVLSKCDITRSPQARSIWSWCIHVECRSRSRGRSGTVQRLVHFMAPKQRALPHNKAPACNVCPTQKPVDSGDVLCLPLGTTAVACFIPIPPPLVRACT